MILKERTLVVSGVGAGLGREVARVALRDGANVCLLYTSDAADE